MAALGASLGLAEELAGRAATPQADAGRARIARLAARLRTVRWWRGVVLGIAGVFFLFPLAAAIRFCVDVTGGGHSLSAFTGILGQQGFGSSLWLTVRLAVVALLVSLALMVPTAIYVHLRLPKVRRVMDGITVLPIVIPPIVLIVGVLAIAPSWLKATPYLLALEYAVLAMPFMYRSLDAGLRAIDLATLVDASRSLGGGFLTTLLRVLVPNLRLAIVSGSILTLALVFGEYTMASLDQYQNFSVWIYVFSQDNAQVSVAASLFGLLIPWLVLLAITFFASGRPGFASGRPGSASSRPGSAAARGRPGFLRRRRALTTIACGGDD